MALLQATVKKENGQTVLVPLFQSQEHVVGEVCIEPIAGKKVDHNGVKIELLGQIELYFDRGNFYGFTSLVRELEVPCEIYDRKTYPFEFSTVEMSYESYNGINVRLRYILKVTISRNYASNIVEYQDFWVQNYTPLPPVNNSIKMEVGIEDCLHIEFEYDERKYHLKDVVIGKIYFLLVRIKIRNMELHPRIGKSFDIKVFTNCRFVMMAWAVLVVTYCIKQYEEYGRIAGSMLVSGILMLVYITKFFRWESGYWSTMDIAA